MSDASTEIMVELAVHEEANRLTQIQTICFNDDTLRHLGRERGGPSGYDSLTSTQDLIENLRFYSIKKDGSIIGGVIISGPVMGILHVNRLFLEPQEQGKGYGKLAMLALEDLFPEVTRMVLDTPAWAKRNQHFYEGLGYQMVGERPEPELGFMLIMYEKMKDGRA